MNSLTSRLLTNQWTGLVLDVVQAIFKNTAIKIEYVDTQWGTAVAGLQSNRFDILGGFNKTPERAKAADFTRPMGAHQMGILTLDKETKKYQNWATINNPQTRLAAIDGSAAVTLLQPQLDKVRWIIVPDSDNMQLQMESGTDSVWPYPVSLPDLRAGDFPLRQRIFCRNIPFWPAIGRSRSG